MNVTSLFEHLFINRRTAEECFNETKHGTDNPEDPKIFHTVMAVMIAWEACGFLWLAWHIRGIGSLFLRTFIIQIYLTAICPLSFSFTKVLLYNSCMTVAINIYHHSQWIFFLFHIVANQKFIYEFSPWFGGRVATFLRKTYYEHLMLYITLVYGSVRGFVFWLKTFPVLDEELSSVQCKTIMTILLFSVVVLWIAFGQLYKHTLRPFDPPPDYLSDRNISSAFSLMCMFDPDIGRLFFGPNHTMWDEVALAIKTLFYFALVVYSPSDADTCGLQVRQDLREIDDRMRQLDTIFEPEAPQVAYSTRTVDWKKIPGAQFIIKTISRGHRYKTTPSMRMSNLEERTQYGAANPI